MPRSNDSTTPPLVQDALLDDSVKLGIVRATFEGFEKSSFEDLISGYSSLKVLTYSSSIYEEAAHVAQDEKRKTLAK